MSEISKFLEHICFICGRGATYRIYHSECAASSTACDEHKFCSKGFSNISRIELPQSEIVRKYRL